MTDLPRGRAASARSRGGADPGAGPSPTAVYGVVSIASAPLFVASLSRNIPGTVVSCRWPPTKVVIRVTLSLARQVAFETCDGEVTTNVWSSRSYAPLFFSFHSTKSRL